MCKCKRGPEIDLNRIESILPESIYSINMLLEYIIQYVSLQLYLTQVHTAKSVSFFQVYFNSRTCQVDGCLQHGPPNAYSWVLLQQFCLQR